MLYYEIIHIICAQNLFRGHLNEIKYIFARLVRSPIDGGIDPEREFENNILTSYVI